MVLVCVFKSSFCAFFSSGVVLVVGFQGAFLWAVSL